MSLWPVVISEGVLSAVSIPPTMQRIRATMVGICASWMMRLRLELAVARLFISFPTTGTMPCIAKLCSDRTWLDTSSVILLRRPKLANRRGLRATDERMAAHSMLVLLGLVSLLILKPAPAVRITAKMAR